MPEPASNPNASSDEPGNASQHGIGAAAEEEGVVDQQAVLKDQIDEQDQGPSS
jgi:hypothetical protein